MAARSFDGRRRHQRPTATPVGEIHLVTPIEDYYSDHDGGKFAPIEATTAATWKARAFLENLAIDAEGAVFVTVYSHDRRGAL
jgi:hypothetical protein